MRLAGTAAIGAAMLVGLVGPAPVGGAADPAEALVGELGAFARTEDAEVERIGRRIWQNEAAGRQDC